MRYAPLTLTTLASLIPPEIPAMCASSMRESMTSIWIASTRSRRHHAITGTAPRAYEISAHLRQRGTLSFSAACIRR